MPKSDDRFYLMELSNRPAMYGDIGSEVRIHGLIVGSSQDTALLFLPDTMPKLRIDMQPWKFHELTVEEWSDFIQRSDDPEILIGLPKIFQRKVRYAISGAVQQKVWAADRFQCLYCGAPMGKALMTIDHFVPLELGGSNDVLNYATACKSCNKSKGSQDPEIWFANHKTVHNLPATRAYLAARVVL